VRIGLCKQNCHYGADDCQPFYVRSRVRDLTSQPFVHRHRVLCTLLFCEERLRQLWSSKTQASKKVVGCSISVTEWSEARRARKDISVLPGYDVTTWYGVFAPRDTPTTAGVAVRGSTAEAFGQHMAREFKRWDAVREAAGIPQQ
jgi:hypothetical protein